MSVISFIPPQTHTHEEKETTQESKVDYFGTQQEAGNKKKARDFLIFIGKKWQHFS